MPECWKGGGELGTDCISTTVDKNIPSKISKKRKSVPWFNRDLKRMVKRKARLYNHAKKSGQWNTFKNFQKDCKKAFKKAEIQHINYAIQKEGSMRITPNHSGALSNLDDKTVLG